MSGPSRPKPRKGENSMASMGWLAALLIFLGLELAFVSLTSLWFAAGALGAFITALAGGDMEIQLVVFTGVSFLTLILIRPAAFFINRHRKAGMEHENAAGFK